jgi:hypothetical protein
VARGVDVAQDLEAAGAVLAAEQRGVAAVALLGGAGVDGVARHAALHAGLGRRAGAAVRARRRLRGRALRRPGGGLPRRADALPAEHGHVLRRVVGGGGRGDGERGGGGGHRRRTEKATGAHGAEATAARAQPRRTSSATSPASLARRRSPEHA